MADLSKLVALSRRFGADPEWVLAGGGNTSFKEAGELFVKASGTSLATIDAAGFCAIDRARLDAMWAASYPADTEAREAAALAELMAARRPGESKRPSVETLMHGLFPQAYVVHTHPAAVNGITCGKAGQAAFESLFGEEGIWVPFVDPGYVLAKTVREALETFRSRHGRTPAIMFMRNHGLLVAGESPAEIEDLSARIMSAVLSKAGRRPELEARAVDARALAEAAATLARLAPGSAIRFRADAETLQLGASASSFTPLSSAFTPDHIVYAGHEFLRVDDPASIETAWADFIGRNRALPRVIVIKNLGVFSCATDAASAEKAMLLYIDACKVAVYAESFGGPEHMAKEKIDFIRNWEVEKYRSSVNTGT
jgi:rhamnose utilization protein RhaD (predicted bifunctional aldolase and dehydrogenase)